MQPPGLQSEEFIKIMSVLNALTVRDRMLEIEEHQRTTRSCK